MEFSEIKYNYEKKMLLREFTKFGSIEGFVLLFLIGNLIIPSVKIGIGVNFITFGAVLIIPLLFVKFGRIKIFPVARHYIYILISMVASLLLGYGFFNISQTYQDWMEIIRYAQILPFFLVIGFLKRDVFFQLLHWAMMIAGFFVILIFAIQYLDIFSFRNLVNSIYASDSQIENLYQYDSRYILTGSDPNVGGLIAATLSIYFGIYYLENRRNIYIVLCVVLFGVSLFTQSRTVVVAYIFSLVIYMVFFANASFFKRFVLSMLVIVSGIYVIFYSDFSYISVGFDMASQGRDESVNVRVENYLNAMEALRSSLFFGFGPSKAAYNSIFDAEYALVLYRYGIFGFFVLVFWYISRFYRAYIFICSNRKPEFNYLAKYIIVTICMISVVMFTNNVLAGYQAVSIFALIGVICGVLERPDLTRRSWLSDNSKN